MNVELARLRSWICDEDQDFRSAIISSEGNNCYLAAEIKKQAQRRFQIHEWILKTLYALEWTPGYTGTCAPGQNSKQLTANVAGPSRTFVNQDSNGGPGDLPHESEEEFDVDAGEDQLDRVVEALDNMM